MLMRLERCWRIVGTGLSFTAFGVGGLLSRVLVFPVLNLLVWERHLRTRLARQLIAFAFRAFVGFMRMLGVLRYDIHGLERLQRSGLLILANHPTLIDTVFLMAFVRNADCIVKGRLWQNPFTRGPIRAAGYIKNADGNGLVESCIESLRGGSNLIVFPEGTRTPPCGDIQFKRGASNVAVRGRRDVTPVIIRCASHTLGKGDKWWRVPPRFSHFVIEIREDIPVQPFIAQAASETLAARHFNEYLQDYFTKEYHRAVA
jgi:1-acyl-sn-glycerol-3-phosphate acyltransferase